MEKEPEYIKDRLRKQISKLTDENSVLKEKLREADRVTTALGILLALASLLAICLSAMVQR
jgi:hypothetical protein